MKLVEVPSDRKIVVGNSETILSHHMQTYAICKFFTWLRSFQNRSVTYVFFSHQFHLEARYNHQNPALGYALLY